MFDFIQSLHFSHPYFMLAILVPVIIVALSYIFNAYTSNRYCDKALLAWAVVKNKNSLADKLFLSKVIPLLTWFLLCVALAGPRMKIDERSLEPGHKYTNAVVVVLDVSKSMLVEDVYPNRITKAKLAIKTLLDNSSDVLFSLVIYANNAHVVIPLTYDANVIRDVLTAIKANMLPVQGSNYVSGLNLAVKQLNSSAASNKSILLFSDGDFDQKVTSSTTLKLEEIKVNVFGVGTHEGQPVPDKNGGWLTINNSSVISRLNEVSLKKIATNHHGIYRAISANMKQDEFNLHKLINSTVATDSSTKTLVIWKQLYSWFLVPAIMLFMFSTMHSIRRKNNFNHVNPLLVLLLSTFFYCIPAPSEAADDSLAAANAAYRDRNFIKSEELYKKTKGFSALIGQANSVYRQKNFTSAIHLYSQAILKAADNNSRATALFNLANTFYMLGDYPQSIELYRDVLKYNPAHMQSKVNLDYAIIIDKRVKRALAIREGRKTTPASRSRVGNGPRSENIEQGVDVGNSKVTLADDNDKLSTLYTLPLSDDAINRLIERGIKYSTISSTKIDTSISGSQWQFEHTTPDMVELLVKQEKMDSYNLWKRLFELEEGFPAPVETPHVKQGVNPW